MARRKKTAAAETAISPNVSRRQFLVVLGGVALGSFCLPALRGAAEDAGESGPLDVGAPQSEATEQLRRLCTTPKKATVGDNVVLTWMEETDEGITTMVWRPSTPEELAEAQRFYESARNYDQGPIAVEAREGTIGKVRRQMERLTRRRRPAEERRLLQAIVDDPDPREPWLEYAAYLESKGDPQGELIRVARLWDECPGDDPNKAAYGDRWAQLLEQHGPQWVKPLAKFGLRPTALGRFLPQIWLGSGLIVHVDIDKPGILPERAAAFFEAAPAVMDLSLNYEHPDLKGIAALPQLAQIRELRLYCDDATDDGLAALFASPHARRLRRLALNHNEISPQRGQQLFQSPQFDALETLELYGCKISDAALRGFSAPGRVRALQQLDLAENSLTSIGLEELARAQMPALKHLNLSGNPLGDDGLRKLSGATWFATLQTLKLALCDLQPGTLATIAQWPCLQLRELNLLGVPATLDDVAALANSLLLKTLEKLDLSYAKLGSQGVARLFAADQPSMLIELTLSSNELGDEGVSRLVDSPRPPKLKTLGLTFNEIGPEGAAKLAGSAWMNGLESLWLGSNPIGSEGAAALATSPQPVALKSLYISRRDIGKAAYKMLEDRYGRDVVSDY